MNALQRERLAAAKSKGRPSEKIDYMLSPVGYSYLMKDETVADEMNRITLSALMIQNRDGIVQDYYCLGVMRECLRLFVEVSLQRTKRYWLGNNHSKCEGAAFRHTGLCIWEEIKLVAKMLRGGSEGLSEENKGKFEALVVYGH